ncbi:MAG: winged helix family transcriptional regulator [Chloroflexi bacterium]|nr:MAG: winged helix family transcriptional regulator [Chloroflexota bacterium]
MFYSQPAQITYPMQIDTQQLWLHADTGEFFIGSKPIEGLTPIQRGILTIMLDRVGVYLTKTDIINAAWPDDIAREGVSDDALFQQMSSLRKRLRRYNAQPFIVTWRGIPEGGYRLLRNGRFLTIPSHTQTR